MRFSSIMNGRFSSVTLTALSLYGMKNQFLKIFLNFKRRRKKNRKSFLQEAPSKTVIATFTDWPGCSFGHETDTFRCHQINRKECMSEWGFNEPNPYVHLYFKQLTLISICLGSLQESCSTQPPTLTQTHTER